MFQRNETLMNIPIENFQNVFRRDLNPLPHVAAEATKLSLLEQLYINTLLRKRQDINKKV